MHLMLLSAPSRSLPAPSPGQREGSDRRLTFNSHNAVHEFDGSSPSKRVLHCGSTKKRAADLADEELRMELEAYNLLDNAENTPVEQQRSTLDEAWQNELREELMSFGFDAAPNTTKIELAARMQLVKRLQRMTHLNMAGCEALPTEMATARLHELLTERHELVDGCAREDLETRLEIALAKEQNVVKGQGYEFGRRFLNLEQYVLWGESGGVPGWPW